MKNQTIFELYTDDNKSKYSSNPKDILKSEKKIMKLYTKLTSTAATTEVVCKIPNRKKISNEHFIPSRRSDNMRERNILGESHLTVNKLGAGSCVNSQQRKFFLIFLFS